jgi:hypothetical protein
VVLSFNQAKEQRCEIGSVGVSLKGYQNNGKSVGLHCALSLRTCFCTQQRISLIGLSNF